MGFSMSKCRFKVSDEDSGKIDVVTLLKLCERAYHLTIEGCSFGSQIDLVQDFIASLAYTTAALSELK